MPAIPFIASFLEHALVHRAPASPPNVTAAGISSHLEVVCAWPVSGQYGPGTRVLWVSLQRDWQCYHDILTRNPDTMS